MEAEKLKSIIESILFITGEPVKISRIAKITSLSEEEVEKATLLLINDYSQGKGVIIVKKDDFIQMATNPDNAYLVGEIVKSEIQENLSQAALEVLSIVAYRSPITRAEIEAIRGVNCSFTLRALLMRGLIERIDNPKDNRGYLYKISLEFLKKVGIDSIEKLPDWETLSKDTRIDSILGKEAGEVVSAGDKIVSSSEEAKKDEISED